MDEDTHTHGAHTRRSRAKIEIPLCGHISTSQKVPTLMNISVSEHRGKKTIRQPGRLPTCLQSCTDCMLWASYFPLLFFRLLFHLFLFFFASFSISSSLCMIIIMISIAYFGTDFYGNDNWNNHYRNGDLYFNISKISLKFIIQHVISYLI